MEVEKPIRIIDKRNKEKFQVDDAYFNGYAKHCGLLATSIYMVLCRHANTDQECWPSEETIAKKLGIASRSVKRGVKKLLDWNIISKEKQIRDERGLWKSNFYILLDKSIWQSPDGVPPVAHGYRGDKNDIIGGTPVAHKGNTVKKETRNLKLATPSVAEQINNLISLFKDVNPSYELLFKNKTERLAAQRLIDKFGFEKISGSISKLSEIIDKKYAPKVTTPFQFEKRLGELIAFVKQEKSINKNVPII